MLKLVHVDADSSTFQLPNGIDDYGTFNEMPKPFVPIDLDEYIQMTYNFPEFIEYRQVINIWPTTRVANILWYRNYGLAVVRPGDWNLVDGKIRYKEPLLYFRIGCDHDMKPVFDPAIRQARGVTGTARLFECTKCYATDIFDSQ